MFYGTDTDISLCQDRSALCVDHVLGNGLKVAVRLNPVWSPFPKREKLPFSVFCLTVSMYVYMMFRSSPFRLEAEWYSEEFPRRQRTITLSAVFLSAVV